MNIASVKNMIGQIHAYLLQEEQTGAAKVMIAGLSAIYLYQNWLLTAGVAALGYSFTKIESTTAFCVDYGILKNTAWNETAKNLYEILADIDNLFQTNMAKAYAGAAIITMLYFRHDIVLLAFPFALGVQVGLRPTQLASSTQSITTGGTNG